MARIAGRGVGRRAYDPAMVVALLLYGYSRGVRSARAIERACVEDVAFKMIAMMGRRITRRSRGLWRGTSSRWLSCSVRCWGCARRRGWSGRGWSRSMGRRWRATPVASPPAILGRSRGRSWRRRGRSMRPRMSSMARSVGMSCPRSCAPGRGGPSSSVGRARAAAPPIRSARDGAAARTGRVGAEGFGFDTERIVARHQGREGWTREAHRQLEQHRWKQGDPSLADVRIGCCSPASGWRPIATPRSRPTGPMRSTGRTGVTRTGGGWAPPEAVGRAGAARGGGERERPRYPADESQPRVRAGL